jgi:hypothetical protein
MAGKIGMGKTERNWPAVVEAAQEYKSRHPFATWAEIGESLGVNADLLRKRFKQHMREQPLQKQVQIETEISTGVDENDPRIASLLNKADVNLDEWQVKRAVVNEWGKERNYQAKVWLEYDPRIPALRTLQNEILDDVREVAQEVAALPAELFDLLTHDDTYMLEVSAAEPHLGKLGWGEEVNDNYDSDIAVQRYKASILDLVGRASRSHGVEEFVYVFGNDFMHIDSKVSTTTAGTFQDTDTRWHKIFRTSHHLARWTIDVLLRFGVPVKVIIVPGNHDELSTFAVGEVISAAYEDNPLVSIDNRASLRKYYRYGESLLGFTHGNEERHDQLPLIMADEAREDWAVTRFNEWHIGHRHNKKSLHFTSHDQFRTIGVRILPSLCGQDYWHYKKGYRHIPQSELHVWHRTQGHVASFTHTSERSHEKGA